MGEPFRRIVGKPLLVVGESTCASLFGVLLDKVVRQGLTPTGIEEMARAQSTHSRRASPSFSNTANLPARVGVVLGHRPSSVERGHSSCDRHALYTADGSSKISLTSVTLEIAFMPPLHNTAIACLAKFNAQISVIPILEMSPSFPHAATNSSTELKVVKIETRDWRWEGGGGLRQDRVSYDTRVPPSPLHRPSPLPFQGGFPQDSSSSLMFEFLADNDVTLSPRERTLLRKMNVAYSETLIRQLLLPLIEQRSAVSLRILDYAVVNWSKQHNVIVQSTVSGGTTNMYHAYREELSFWKRRLFDPFRRRGRVSFELDGKTYQTTLGQANFALFVYQTGILAYVTTHVDAIEDDMNAVNVRHRKMRAMELKLGLRHRRKELTYGEPQPCCAYEHPSLVTFD